ncbi:hypothetical protein A4H97_30130 [Niastella yeongjuensis]|uniref:Lipid/polyisoprenoid-binding YceI-like domain-containing protein n=1 Tax=Niastella yeongjuensis TaxID=354355 RepID=A0A1V9EPY9_9BACT|nr:YceI family protein [Niastella yeongjuensis]OQP48092.1 hypothetical protein A4H97_30130 [Niastella yeongjuensis]SEO26396.1 Polyisoprenoid-binding protein YceI [Niastella yeongjuensis]
MEEINKLKWHIDPGHSNIRFAVRHLQISMVEGQFLEFEGGATSSDESFLDGAFNISLVANSITTKNDIRDQNIRSANFLEVETYPNITFSGENLSKAVGSHFQLQGQITIKKTTLPITLGVEYFGASDDFSGNRKAGFQVTGTIPRFEFDVSFQRIIGGNVLDVGLNVEVVCNIELMKTVLTP